MDKGNCNGPYLDQALNIAEFKYAHKHFNRVMISTYPGFHEKVRHLQLYKDDNGLYVRVGRRKSQVKKYLKNMNSARLVDVSLSLVIFYEYANP